MLKEIAMENQIGVFALAQFNRQAANGERPELHHLAESSGIEKDASLVLILDMARQEDREVQRDCVMRVAKNRNGPLLSLPYKYKGDTLTFEELDGEPPSSGEEPRHEAALSSADNKGHKGSAVVGEK